MTDDPGMEEERLDASGGPYVVTPSWREHPWARLESFVLRKRLEHFCAHPEPRYRGRYVFYELVAGVLFGRDMIDEEIDPEELC